MTSLLVDGRPIHGDPGLPAVSRVFSDVREHPGTMRLLLQEPLAYRARLRSAWLPARRPETFDIKRHGLLPVVNIARWAALSVGSAVLPTTERLRVASGSAMLPADAADTLIEVFDVLQRLRLRYQIRQYRAGKRPTDVVALRAVASRPQRDRAGGPGDLRGPAPDGQRVALRRRRGVGVAGASVNRPRAAPQRTAPDRTSVGGGVTATVRRRPASAGWAAGSPTAPR